MNNIVPPDFKWKTYISMNSDIKHITNKLDAIRHYYSHGVKENRSYKFKIPDDFNWKAYVKLNLDITHITNQPDAITHFCTYGVNENRIYKYKIPSDFNWKAYINLNPDVKNLTNEADVMKHYCDYGVDANLKYYTHNHTNLNLHKLPSHQLLISNHTTFAEKTINIYSSFNDADILLTKPFFVIPNYKQYSVNENILNNLNSFFLIIDFENGGGGTTFFLNTIVSKYK